MAARFPQSTTSVAYRIKPAYASKILVLYWAASADSAHRLRSADTASTILTRAASGATFDAANGRIIGTSTTYFSDSIAGGYGALRENSDYTLLASYYGDTFNAVPSGTGRIIGIGATPPPDSSDAGGKIFFEGYNPSTASQNTSGAAVGGFSNDVPKAIVIAMRSVLAGTPKQRVWAAGAEKTGYNAAPSSSSLMGDTARPIYFGGTYTGTGNTKLAFEMALIATGALTDADMAAITADPSTLIEVVAADTVVPTMTGTITSSGVTSSGFVIDWSGTTRSDNVAIAGYETSPDGGTTWIDRGNVTSVTFTGLSPSTSYARLVRAYDAAGNKSTPALSITVVTSASAGDTTLPVLSGSITQGTVTPTTSQISWPAGSDNVAVTSYEVSKDNGATYIDVGNVLTYTFTGLTASTSYTQRVRAKDAAGNVSTPALSLAVTSSAAPVGSFTSRPLVNNTGTVLASQAGWSVRINNSTTGTLIATKTALTTSTLGVLTYSDAGCTAGTSYEHIYTASNGDKGLQDLVAA